MRGAMDNSGYSLAVEELSVSFETKPVIRGLSHSFPPVGVMAIVGPSGCGKSTLLRCLAGLQAPDCGRVLGLAGKRLSMVFQEHRLLPWYDALTNVTLVCAGDKRRARAALDLVELGEEEHKLPLELSGGMQRRLALARALAYDGDILLLDEPAAGLDEQLSFRVLERALQQWRERPVIIISHERELVSRYADYIYDVTGRPIDSLRLRQPGEKTQ